MIILYKNSDDYSELWHWDSVEQYIRDITGMYYDRLNDDIMALNNLGITVLRVDTKIPVVNLSWHAEIDLVLQFDSKEKEMLFRLKYL